jgi:hypothetical protein
MCPPSSQTWRRTGSWLSTPLRQAYAEAEATGDLRKQLHASLALLPADEGQVEYLLGRALTGRPAEVMAIITSWNHTREWQKRLWAILEDQRERGAALRAACCLAAYAPRTVAGTG